MIGEKTSKITEIKDTLSCAVEIIHLIRTPGAQESFSKVMGVAGIAKDIIEAFKTPEMVKNIENIRLISENINEASTKMQNTIKQIEETGVIEETRGLIKSVKNTVDLVKDVGAIPELALAIREIAFVARYVTKDIRRTTEV